MTTIRYFIPDDGDTEDAPNVFLAPKPSSSSYNQSPPQLGIIKSSFPLPGKYYFRFKTSLGSLPGDTTSGLAVWMDCIDESKPVPTFHTSIIAKVTRLSADDDDFDDDGNYEEEEEDYDSDQEFEQLRQNSTATATANNIRAVSNATAAAIAAAKAVPTASSNNYRTASLSSNPVSPRASPTPSNTQPQHHAEDLFNVFDDSQANQTPSTTYSNPPSSHPSSTDLFEEDTTFDDFLSGSTTAPAAPVVHSSGDLLGMTATTGIQHPHQHRSAPAAAHSHNSNLSAAIPANMPTNAHHHHQQPTHQQPTQYQQQQQQQSQQQYPATSSASNAFDQFSTQKGPFGGLNWK